MPITLEQFTACTGATPANAQVYYPFALVAMGLFKIAEDQQVAAFLATLGIESEYLTHMEEDLFYSHADRLVAIFPHEFHTAADAAPFVRNPKGLSQKIYGGYHGRGGIQLSWLKNYKLHGDRLGFDYVGQPDLVKTPQHAMLTAGSYWDLTKCNDIAADMGEVTLRVNGPAREALAARIAQRDRALEVLA